jgi:transposase
VRVTTAFNKLLALNATFVQAVNFDPSQIIVTVRLARRRLRCPDCNVLNPMAVYDRRPKPSKWRHLDVCGQPLIIACSLRRSGARPTGSYRAGALRPPRARVTHDFENLVVWCVTSMDRTAATVLCRVAWRTVNAIIERVVPIDTGPVPD